MKDNLGNRMKSSYEDRAKTYLPRRTYTIIRLDQKCGHTYARGLFKPFDEGYIGDINESVKNILPEIHGARLAYCQSDEISILLTDFEKETTNAWFDGNVQKIVSVSASLMTAEFNRCRLYRYIDRFTAGEIPNAYFDSRCFTIPDPTEVYNYFVWRWKDCERNSISSTAQANFSHKQLEGKSCKQMQEMLMTEKGLNWSQIPERHKNGRFIVKEEYEAPIKVREWSDLKIANSKVNITTAKTEWVVKPGWKITESPDKLLDLVPKYP